MNAYAVERRMKVVVGALVAVAMLLGVLVGTASAQRAVAIMGRTNVAGEEVIVEILVVVHPGENPNAKARATLKRVYPDVREIDSAEFSTIDLFWDRFSDGDPGNDFVLVNYNSKGVPDTLGVNHRSVWVDSQKTWTDVESSIFQYNDGGDTGRCPSLVRECKGRQKFDGNNDVGWLDIADPSVLGVTWSGTSTDEFDMVLDNKNFNWYIGNPTGIPTGHFDVQTVWIHEFGHGIGLGHSDEEGAIMESFYEGVRRTLHQDDVDGITFLYPAGPTSVGSIAGTVTNFDDSMAISGAMVSADTGQSATTAADGTYTITGVPTGNRSVTASASGFESQTRIAPVTDGGTALVDFALTPATLATDVIVTSPSGTNGYATEGGKNGDKHLLITVALEDNLGDPVAGASVSIGLLRDGFPDASGSGTTGTDGTVTFSLKNAKSGCYTTTVTRVIVEAILLDPTPLTPSNEFCKGVQSAPPAHVILISKPIVEGPIFELMLVSPTLVKVEKTVLWQNYPNPFNPETWIPLKLSKSEHVFIKIYNNTGKLVRTLDLGRKPAGAYVSRDKAAYWDGRNANGEQVSSGVYFYRMEADAFSAMKKMVIMK